MLSVLWRVSPAWLTTESWSGASNSSTVFIGPLSCAQEVIGALVGAVAWFAPDWVGGGDGITQRTLLGGQASLQILLVLAVRFLRARSRMQPELRAGFLLRCWWWEHRSAYCLPPFPDCFFPMCNSFPPPSPSSAMAAFFTAVVRAPVTGIVLIIELTASFTQLLPMLWACFAAMVVPTFFRNTPIYASLSQPVLQSERSGVDPVIEEVGGIMRQELLLLRSSQKRKFFKQNASRFLLDRVTFIVPRLFLIWAGIRNGSHIHGRYSRHART